MLMFGPRLAQLALYLVMAGVAATGIAGFEGYPANALLAGALPVWVSWLLLQLIERRCHRCTARWSRHICRGVSDGVLSALRPAAILWRSLYHRNEHGTDGCVFPAMGPDV
jgi:hypothetical protein